LGLCLKMQGRYDEAYAAFYKATWSGPQQGGGFFSLAQIASIQGKTSDAIEFADRAIAQNAGNQKAWHLRAALLRRSDRISIARREMENAIALDPLDFGALFEMSLLAEDRIAAHKNLLTALRGDPQNLIELALDYTSAGFYDDALNILSLPPRSNV